MFEFLLSFCKCAQHWGKGELEMKTSVLEPWACIKLFGYVGGSSQATHLMRNSAMDDSIGGS